MLFWLLTISIGELLLVLAIFLNLQQDMLLFTALSTTVGFLVTALLLMVGLILADLKKYQGIPLYLFIAGFAVNLLIFLTGTQFLDMMLITIVNTLLFNALSLPAMLIFLYYAYKAKSFTISFFSIGLLIYGMGGAATGLFANETGDIIFSSAIFIANLIFFIGIVVPKAFKASKLKEQQPIA